MSSTVLFIIIFFHFSYGHVSPNVVVDTHGSGNYKTVKEAVDNAPNKSMSRYTIHVKEGHYNEYVHVLQEKWNITMVGDGKGKTIITSSRSQAQGFKINASAALRIEAPGFLLKHLTVMNTAGAEGKQAVALYSNSPYSAFYDLDIEGYQDTLYVGLGPQFFSECSIHGTVDFIFGDHGHAVFQKCQIYARENIPDKENVITANGCTKKYDCGFSFHLCNITGEGKLLASKSPTRTFLGRPWKDHSTTVFMESQIAQVIDGKGWLDYRNMSLKKTLYYGEYTNTGMGAAVNHRVGWIGVHSSISKRKAKSFTVDRFISGHEWLPKLGVKYVAGLSS